VRDMGVDNAHGLRHSHWCPLLSRAILMRTLMAEPSRYSRDDVMMASSHSRLSGPFVVGKVLTSTRFRTRLSVDESDQDQSVGTVQSNSAHVVADRVPSRLTYSRTDITHDSTPARDCHWRLSATSFWSLLRRPPHDAVQISFKRVCNCQARRALKKP